MLAFAAPSFAATERHIVLDDCVVMGCANEICTDVKTAAEEGASACAANHPAVSQCYNAHGECLRQADGKCGWKPSAALAACIANPPVEPGSQAPKPLAATSGATAVPPTDNHVISDKYRQCSADKDCLLTTSGCDACSVSNAAVNGAYKAMDFQHCTKDEAAARMTANCANLVQPTAVCTHGLCTLK